MLYTSVHVYEVYNVALCIVDSRDGRRPLSQDGRLSSRASSRSLPPLDLVNEANRQESLKFSIPPTSSRSIRSGKSVNIAEEVTEIRPESRAVTKTPTKL